jgi:hypothetical protein
MRSGETEIKYTDLYLMNLARAMKPITTPTLKLGGNPVFFEDIEWPNCKICGKELDFLAQIPLQSPLLLSKSFSMAYIFMCPGDYDEKGWLVCKPFEANSGSNLIILQKAKKEYFVHAHITEYPDYQVELVTSREPIIDTTEYDLYNELIDEVLMVTKLGGTPLWIQTNEEPKCPNCGGEMKLIAQFDAPLDGMLPADSSEWDTGKFKFFHFGGDDGVGYAYICENDCGPNSSSFLYQCS